MEVLYQAPGAPVGLDLVVVPMRETWAAWFTTDDELVRMAPVGQC